MATSKEQAEMAALVSEVRTNYGPARDDARKLRADAAGFLGSLTVAPAQLAVAKAIEDLGPQIERWATTWHRDALAGRNSEGFPYTPTKFLDAGKIYKDAIKSFRGEAYKASPAAVLSATFSETVKDVKTVVTPSLWPTHVKVIAGVAVVVVVLVVVRPYLTPLIPRSVPA